MPEFGPNTHYCAIARVLGAALAASVLACSGGDKPAPESTVTLQVAEPSPASTESPSAEMTVTGEVTVAGGTVALGDAVTVAVPPDALAADTTVTITRASPSLPAPADPELVASIGSAFVIDLGGQDLARPVVLEIAFDPTLLREDTPDYAIFAAYYAEAEGVWVPIRGQVDRERNVIVVETDHLSWWQPWTWDLSEISSILANAFEGVVDPSRFVADPPQCGRDDPTVALSFDHLLFFACDEQADDPGYVTIRIVNNRTYGLTLVPPPEVAVHAVSQGSWSELVVVTFMKPFGDAWYIPPAGQAELLIRLDQPGEVYLPLERDHWAGAIDGLLSVILYSLASANPESVGPIDITCIERAAAVAADLETAESVDITTICKQALSGVGGFSIIGTVVQLLEDLLDTIALRSSAITVIYTQASSLQGTWEGEVREPDLQYSTVLTLTGCGEPNKICGSVDYPELACGGTIT